MIEPNGRDMKLSISVGVEGYNDPLYKTPFIEASKALKDANDFISRKISSADELALRKKHRNTGGRR